MKEEVKEEVNSRQEEPFDRLSQIETGACQLSCRFEEDTKMEKDKKEKKKDKKAKKALNHSLFGLWAVVCANHWQPGLQQNLRGSKEIEENGEESCKEGTLRK